MSSPINAQLNGSFTTPAALVPVPIPLPSGYTQIKIYNDTDIAAGAAGINIIEGKATFPAHNCITYTGVPLVPAINNVAGISFVADSGDQTPGPAVVVTAITAASPGVISSASTAGVGDIVRVYGTTGMLQVGGWDFTLTAVNPGVTQTSQNLIAAGFAAPATAGFIRTIPFLHCRTKSPRNGTSRVRNDPNDGTFGHYYSHRDSHWRLYQYYHCRH